MLWNRPRERSKSQLVAHGPNVVCVAAGAYDRTRVCCTRDDKKAASRRRQAVRADPIGGGRISGLVNAWLLSDIRENARRASISASTLWHRERRPRLVEAHAAARHYCGTARATAVADDRASATPHAAIKPPKKWLVSSFMHAPRSHSLHAAPRALLTRPSCAPRS